MESTQRKGRIELTGKSTKINRSATDRLRRLIDSELSRRGLNGQEVAREARLPADAFRSLRRGYRPTIDRADELCRALGVTMLVGKTPAGTEVTGVAADDEQRSADQ